MLLPSLMRRWLWACGLALGGHAATAAPANTALHQETRSYSDGVGRIAWQWPGDVELMFAVPHFTAGPRLLCRGERYECEITVSARDLSVPAAQRRQALEELLKPDLPNATDPVFKTTAHGVRGEIVLATIEDRRPKEDYRFLTRGYLARGTAVVRFAIASNDPADTARLLDVVDASRTTDTLPLWTIRLHDYVATCATRFPAYHARNAAALKNSPFSRADAQALARQIGNPATGEDAVQWLKEIRQDYAESFDKEPRERQDSFCAGLPTWIRDAAADLPAR